MVRRAPNSFRNVKPKVVHRNDNYTKEDQISGLPDEVLVSILSLLTLREAVATSILSKRWRHLWKFITHLDFGNRESYVRMDSAAYVQLVNQVVRLHKSQTLERFKVCFQLDGRFKHEIDNWIKFSLSRNTRMLELDFSWGCPCQNYTLSFALIGAKFLKELHMRFVDVIDEVLGQILSYCPMLEHLCLDGCDRLVTLKVAGASLKLKSLVIYLCRDIEAVDIYDVNIVSLTYLGKLIPLRIEKVPALVDLRIGGLMVQSLNDAIPQLSSCLPQLETFTIELAMLYKGEGINVAPQLTNLKEFVLSFTTEDKSLLDLMPLLKASPYLRKVVVQGRCVKELSMERKEAKNVVRFPHYFLRDVEFVNYSGCTSDLEIVQYLLEIAVALEKITVVIDKNIEWAELYSNKSTGKESDARMQAKQQLEGIQRPVGVTLDII